MDKQLIPDIKSKIYHVRNLQVMLDKDLAELYGVKPIRLREQVKRNIKRFPDDFMFRLDDEEIDFMVSQNAIPSRKHLGGYKPYVFTEQGVANLSAILSSKKAIDVNIQIMRAFVAMRRFISANAQVFYRIDRLELKNIEYDKRFDELFDAIHGKELPNKGIFFDGQVFDAYKFISDIIKSAEKSIILIDNYIDESVLILFSKRNKDVKVTIYTRNITKQLSLDIEKYNAQYAKIDVKEFRESHDRFMIIDGVKLYHFGASLKDLGKKWFAFSRIDKESVKILDKLEG